MPGCPYLDLIHSKAAQGQELSLDLLKDAIERAVAAAEMVGATAMVVHPLNERLAELYKKHAGFERCPEISTITIMLPLV